MAKTQAYYLLMPLATEYKALKILKVLVLMQSKAAPLLEVPKKIRDRPLSIDCIAANHIWFKLISAEFQLEPNVVRKGRLS